MNTTQDVNWFSLIGTHEGALRFVGFSKRVPPSFRNLHRTFFIREPSVHISG